MNARALISLLAFLICVAIPFGARSQDTDGDGMTDAWEVANGLNQNDPADGDDDQEPDGLNNWMEFFFATDPNLADSDGDGLDDYEEIFNAMTDPVNPDSDGDGLDDGWEFMMGTDPYFNDAQSDPDGDGLSNAEEFLYGTDPFFPDNDHDRDGLANNVEDNSGVMVDSAHTGTSPLNPDTDGGGELDGLEVYLGRDPNGLPTDDVRWNAPDGAVQDTNQNMNRPQMAVSAGDTVLMTYVFEGATDNLCWSTWNDSTQWSAPTCGYGSTAQMPRLKTHPDGSVWLYWIEYGVFGLDWSLRRAAFGGQTFSGEQELFVKSGSTIREPFSLLHQFYDVAISEEGYVLVAYVNRAGGSQYYLKTQYNHLGPWNAGVANGSSTSLMAVNLAYDSYGGAHLVWHTELSSREDEINHQWAGNGYGSWDAIKALGVAENPYAAPTIAADRNGSVYAAWNYREDVYATIGNSRAWREPVNLSNSGGIAYDSGIFVDAFGAVNLAWLEQHENINVIRHSMVAKRQWLAPVTVGNASENTLTNVTESFTGASNKRGDLFLAWKEREPGHPSAYRDLSYARLIYPDEDGDLLNSRFEFLLGSDHTATDTDADGYDDGDEIINVGTDPTNPDTDLDGIDDGAEAGYGADPTVVDTDTGGEQDGLEIFAGRDPTSAAEIVIFSRYPQSANQPVKGVGSGEQVGIGVTVGAEVGEGLGVGIGVL